MAAPRRRKMEDTDIDQILYPKLEAIGIKRQWVKRNISTKASGLKRGDLWIADVGYTDANFEKRILTLVECKDHSATIGDRDWNIAAKDGQGKAKKQKLNAFFATNTSGSTRCYNTITMEEITLDGKLIAEIQPVPVLRAIQTQVTAKNSNVLYASFTAASPDSKQFRASLWNLRQIYRASGISKGSEDLMIKITLTFGILKLISEQQKLVRTIPDTILLWSDWRSGILNRDISGTISDLVGIDKYKHLRDSLGLDRRLDSESCQKIKDEFSKYSLYASDFDFFGLIYESLANKELKRDFGEFYTPRHLIRSIVKLRLCNETSPRSLQICDPACGTGGFLVEAFLFLQRSFEKTKTLNKTILKNLKNKTFYGYDTNDKVSIPFARTNMIMADDGGANIQKTDDSLMELPENKFDYVLANVPYGKYDGKAQISNFEYTGVRRYELLFVEKIVRSLRPGGKCAVIVPDGLAESTSNDKFRMKLLQDVTMEAVISLPSFTFEPYTSEKTYVMFFTKRRPADKGGVQTSPIWHFIVDNDGFQDGKKRYPISEDDLPLLEQVFMKKTIPGKAGAVDMAIVKKNYYSFSSESYLRRRVPIEMSFEKFKKILSSVESSMKED